MNQRTTPLADAIAEFLADSRITPFTTPGHKRSPELADDLLGLDLPLSAGADDLHLSRDLLGRAERLAAELWGADLCRFCVNGSTQGNEALALAVAGGPSPRVVVSRNLHKSLFAGLVLAGLDPVWVRPDVDPSTGLALSVSPDRVEAALAGGEASAVLLVEPNFVGVLSDVAAIAGAAHAAGAVLCVDQAWGAHLGFHPDLPPHTLALGADGMVTSAHKTLTGFTQSAFLFARAGRLDLVRLGESFELLHTTSPAAAILGSLDRTRALIALRGAELLGRTVDLVAAAKAELRQVDGLGILGPDAGVPAYDPTKLVLALPGTGADGLAVEADLWAAGVRVELANRDTLVPLVTLADTAASVERLVTALHASIERRRAAPRTAGGASAVWRLEPTVALSREAFFAPRETVSAERSAGRVAAETVAPYPPGIPAIAPGEVITRELLAGLREAARDGTRIAYCADPSLATLQVVARRAGPRTASEYDRPVAYDEELAARIRELLRGESELTERRMFGGLAFLVGGNMAVAASGQGGLLVRVDPARSDALCESTSARPMEMRGRPMRGWLRLDADAVGTKRQLGKWVRLGVSYARSLPAKR